jgi:hypothetical protein
MTELENNFSLYRRNSNSQLKIGSNWFPLTKGTDAEDRESYSYEDERGIAYRVYWFKNERKFGDLYVDSNLLRKRQANLSHS